MSASVHTPTKKKTGYLQMWDIAYIARDLELPSLEKLALVVLASYAKNDGRGASPGIARLARNIGVKERKAQYLLRALEDKGLISTQSRAGGKGHYTEYTILAQRVHDDAPIDIERVHSDAPYSPQRVHSDAPIALQRVHEMTPKGARNDAKGCTDLQFLPSVLNELDKKLIKKLEGGAPVRTYASNGADLEQGTADDPEEKIKTDRRAEQTREEKRQKLYAESPYPDLTFWDDPDFDEMDRGRIFNPKSEWAYQKYLAANGQSLWTRDDPIWAPKFRQFCTEMQRYLRNKGGIPA